MTNGRKDIPVQNEIPTPPQKREAEKLIQVKVPMSLYKKVKRLSAGEDPRHGLSMKAIVRWGLEEWAARTEKNL